MSTITTIASTDHPKDSRAVINTNISNLNTDKLETLSNVGTGAVIAKTKSGTNAPLKSLKSANASLIITENTDDITFDLNSTVSDASTTVKGITKLSVAPASPTAPIAVGDNDGRVPTQGENDALVGNNTSIAVGTGNKVVTQTVLQNRAETYATSTGSANAYVLTLSPVPTALAAGQEFEFKANFANTGAATLNVNSLGAIAIKKLDGATALASGDIANGQVVKVKYDGTNFQMLNPIAQSPTGSFVGAPVSNSSSTTQNIDSVFTTTFLPKAISLYYNITGQDGAGSATSQSGIAMFNGTTFAASFVGSAAGGTSPSTGSGSGMSVSLSITSVTTTGFTVRATYTHGSFSSSTASFYPVAIA
jgi:hypothetical protein